MNALELTQDLVRIDTINPPGNERGCADYLGKVLTDRHFEVSRHEFAENRTSLIARIPGTTDALPLCFTGHIDTVPLGAAPWSHDPFAGETDGRRLFGRGTTDMKAAIAAFVLATESIARGKRPRAGLELVLTAGEETGCEGAMALARTAGALAPCGAIVVGEPTSNEPLVGHKGAYWLKLVTRGVTAHGSMPEQGVNAVYKAAAAVGKLAAYGWPHPGHDLLGSPTLNVGTIRGGMNANSVPDRAVIGVDIRTVPGQSHARIRSDLAELLGEDVEIEEVVGVEGFWSDPEGEWVQRVFDVTEKVQGERPQPRGAPYFTDGPVLARACGDPPTVILGPGDPALAHQTDESCSIDRLEQSVELYRRIAEQWCLAD